MGEISRRESARGEKSRPRDFETSRHRREERLREDDVKDVENLRCR